jgi:hypothetical protein
MAKHLFCAAINGHAAVTKLLIAARCNVDLQMNGGFTPNQKVLVCVCVWMCAQAS